MGPGGLGRGLLRLLHDGWMMDGWMSFILWLLPLLIGYLGIFYIYDGWYIYIYIALLDLEYYLLGWTLWLSYTGLYLCVPRIV